MEFTVKSIVYFILYKLYVLYFCTDKIYNKYTLMHISIDCFFRELGDHLPNAAA